MMTDLLTIYNIYRNRTPSMTARIEAAVVVWCEAVFSEDAGTADHANRVLFAQRCLDETKRQKAVLMLLPLFATNADFQSQGDSFSDGAIAWVVNHYLSTATALAGLLAGLA